MNRLAPFACLALTAGLALAWQPKSAAAADRVELRPSLARPYLLANRKQLTYLQIAMDPFDLQDTGRAPVNVSIVIDRSGSMSGQKIRRAKEAAIMAIDRLQPDDIVSVVAYNHTVEVLVPATKVRDRRAIVDGINRLWAGGSTALFAGVSKGAEEVRKFLDRERVNRIVLLSDGLANVGPSSPAALGALGASLGREGIGVTTIGLGLDYNEDLMTQLALRSEGNHFFARTADDLRRGFDLEFSIGLAVVAKEVLVEVECAPGVRPVRVLNAEADIVGQRVVIQLNQLYSGRPSALLVEVEVPGGEEGQLQDVARVGLSYANMLTHRTDKLTRDVQARFTGSASLVERSEDRGVMEAVVLQLANEKYKLAVELRDQGRTAEARRMLEDNDAYLQQQGAFYKSKKLKDFGMMNRASSERLDPGDWKAERKKMRDVQLEMDQAYEAY